MCELLASTVGSSKALRCVVSEQPRPRVCARVTVRAHVCVCVCARACAPACVFVWLCVRACASARACPHLFPKMISDPRSCPARFKRNGLRNVVQALARKGLDSERPEVSTVAQVVAMINSTFKTVWQSGLRCWLQAPVRKGVGSNPLPGAQLRLYVRAEPISTEYRAHALTHSLSITLVRSLNCESSRVLATPWRPWVRARAAHAGRKEIACCHVIEGRARC